MKRKVVEIVQGRKVMRMSSVVIVGVGDGGDGGRRRVWQSRPLLGKHHRSEVFDLCRTVV